MADVAHVHCAAAGRGSFSGRSFVGSLSGGGGVASTFQAACSLWRFDGAAVVGGGVEQCGLHWELLAAFIPRSNCFSPREIPELRHTMNIAASAAAAAAITPQGKPSSARAKLSSRLVHKQNRRPTATSEHLMNSTSLKGSPLCITQHSTHGVSFYLHQAQQALSFTIPTEIRFSLGVICI